MASIIYSFAVRDNAATPPGTRKTGLAPTWVFLKALADLSDLATPAIVEIAQGQYKFAFDAEELGEAAGQIDAGAALTNPADRYLDVLLTKDSGRVQTALPNKTAGSALGGLAVLSQSPQTGNPMLVGAGEDVMRFAKTSVASLPTSAIGRWLYDSIIGILAKVGLLGTVGATYPDDVPEPGELGLVCGDTYSEDLGNRKQFQSPPGFPDPTGKTVMLGVGPLNSNTVLFTTEADSVSWDSGTGVVTALFPFTAAETASLDPETGRYGGSWEVDYGSGLERTGGLFEVVVSRKYSD